MSEAAFLLLIIFVLPDKLIKIKKIECKSQYGECPPEINSKLKLQDLRQIRKIKKAIRDAFAGNSLISDFSTQYIFPDKLKVNVLLKRARYAILNKDTGKLTLLGSDGEIMGTAGETSLPTISQSGDLPNFFALALMEGVANMYQIYRGEIENNSLKVELPDGKRVIFPLEGDKELLLGSLRLIYPKVENREIDLRFKNPILR